MKKHRLFFGFVVGAAVGLGGETLAMLQRQCVRVEQTLHDDFRVVLFLKSDLEEGKQQVLEEQLRALPDVEDVRAVSRQDALEALRREEPELVQAVAFLSDNPLQPAFEVKLDEAGLGKLPQWLTQASALADWADVRYKPSQVEAALQAAFYARFIGVALSGLVCLVSILALAGLWTTLGPGKAHWSGWARALFSHPDAPGGALAGGLFGACIGAAVALPLRSADNLLGYLDYSSLMPRPQHTDADDQLQAIYQEVVNDQIRAIEEAHPGQEVRTYFHDEARFGQQGTITRVWAPRGSRPRAVRQTQYTYLFVLVAICVSTGTPSALIVPQLHTGAINAFLEQLSRELPPHVHAIVLWDQAGYHTGAGLVVPSNISVILLPPHSPELNPVENLWHYLRSHHWSNRMYRDYDELEAEAIRSLCKVCLDAELVMSICAAPYIRRGA